MCQGFTMPMNFLLRKRIRAGFGVLKASSSAMDLTLPPNQGYLFLPFFFLEKKCFFFSQCRRVFFLFDSFLPLHFEALHILIFHFTFYFFYYLDGQTKMPGFRFQPTNVQGKNFHSKIIVELDLYKFALWDLPRLHLHSFHGVLYCVMFSFSLCVCVCVLMRFCLLYVLQICLCSRMGI